MNRAHQQVTSTGAGSGRTGRLFVVSGPSGVGKDTLLDRLFPRLAGVVRSVSATTRAPRQGEVDGVDYHFLTPEQFQQGIAHGAFLEYAQYGSNFYGTPRDWVEQRRAQGFDVILKIEVQGALEVRQRVPGAVLVFIQPPSLEELERRLRARGTDSEERVRERLAIAQREMACIPHYHYLITNDEIEEAVDQLRAVILAERCRIHPQ
ncbi:MAG: guanylate kinase [Chloroherpetonaceae bacterium]|nr:guanylate kinase [Chthonomonadaceae bacterium]MDW8207087.1 guanylate kinase [Chloroherpetonaceae bacterium]